MIDAMLRESLTAFDDDTLATLANPGLVRRAHRDVEEGKVRLISCDDGKASIEADGQLVLLDARGPKAASCACKSVMVCRHRIAAVIFAVAQQTTESSENVGTNSEADVDPAEIVTSMELAMLEKWAGKANWRAALEVVACATNVEPSANAVAVTFSDLDDPVRILRGQGFDGIVSKASKARQKAYHAAAVLAARGYFGAALPVAAEEPEEAAARELEIDPAFLTRVEVALIEVALLGMNLAPLPLEESLFELSVSSRADSLPRLAALLRTIAAQMRLRRNRSLDYDPDRMLELAATAYALVKALNRADSERRFKLAGKVRRDFEPAAPLHLVGCGGERWTTTSGARGVTAWFIEPETGRWLSTTIARGPGQDHAFMPAEAWRNQAYWQSETLNVIAHARIELHGSRRSADDRLSAPASAKAKIIERAIRPEPTWPGVVKQWEELERNWLGQVGLGLNSTETAAVCLIAPVQIAAPYFDDLAQQLIWPVCDAEGNWIGLCIDHEEPISTAIEALEANVKSGWQGMVLVRMERVGNGLALRPITLFGRDDPVDLSLWSKPWGKTGERPSVRDWLTRLRPGVGRRFELVPQNSTDIALTSAWRHLLDRAEVGPSLARSLDKDLAGHNERLDSYGMPHLARLLQNAKSGQGLLAAAYAMQLARQQRCSVRLLS